jgi:quercetin dioxygenase-like cupin family protein
VRRRNVSRWELASLSEIETIAGPGSLEWAPVRRHFGINAFGINAYVTTAAGQDVIERHTEEVRQHEEAYIVVSGRATFTLGDEVADAPSGTIVFIGDPAVERSAVAAEPGTTVVAIGARPGASYTPGPWEPIYIARARGRDGDYGSAIEELERGLEVHPDHPILLYRLAGWEALDGRRDAALDHLARAVTQRESLREQANGDESFDSIRGDPRFPTAPS